MGIINDDAKVKLLEFVENFNMSDEDLNTKAQARKDFVSVFTRDRIKGLKPEDYFPHEGKKDVLGYQLEWGTLILGSIKGGSMAKYGAAEQFKEIKELLIKLISYSDSAAVFYDTKGNLTKESQSLSEDSRNILGMKSGCTDSSEDTILISSFAFNNFAG